MSHWGATRPFTVAALYRFARFTDCPGMREPLVNLCQRQGVRGTLLLAPEGINGTIAGTEKAIEIVVAHIRGLPDCADLEVKYSSATGMPFHRMKVRIKREIVTMGEAVDPRMIVGTYVEAKTERDDLGSGHDRHRARNDYEGPSAHSLERTTATATFGLSSMVRSAGRACWRAEGSPGGDVLHRWIRCESRPPSLSRGRGRRPSLSGGILKYIESA